MYTLNKTVFGIIQWNCIIYSFSPFTYVYVPGTQKHEKITQKMFVNLVFSLFWNCPAIAIAINNLDEYYGFFIDGIGDNVN